MKEEEKKKEEKKKKERKKQARKQAKPKIENQKLDTTSPKSSETLIVNGIKPFKKSTFPRNINVIGAFQQSLELFNNPVAPHGVFQLSKSRVQGIIEARRDSNDFLSM